MDLLSLIWGVVGAIVTFLLFVIRKSFSAGSELEKMITKDEVDAKILVIKTEFERKLNEVDNKIEVKLRSIEDTLKVISDSLIKQETRESERFRFEQETKENGKQSLDRMCNLIVEMNKKQEDLSRIVSSHDGILNRRQSNISFTE